MNVRQGRGKVAAAFAAIYIIWGSTFLAIRYGIETVPPFFLAGSRFLAAGLALYFWRRWRGEPRPAPVHWRSAAVVGAFLFLGGNGLMTWAELFVPSGAAALLVATVPLWIAVLQTAFERSARPRWNLWLGIVLGLSGLALLTGAGTQGAALDRMGVLAILSGALSWAVGSLYSRRAALPPSALLAAGMEMISGGALLLTAGFLLGEARGFHLAAVSARSALALAYLIVFGALGGFTCYSWLLKKVDPVKVSSYAYVNPVVAVFLGWALAGEPLTLRTMTAAAGIVAAVALMTLAPARAAEAPVSEV